MGSEWWVGLDSWVIQDGNYPDFVTGERHQFALEFGYARTNRLRSTTQVAPGWSYTGRGTTYDVTGEVVRTATEPMADAYVLDFGLPAYAHWLVLDDGRPVRTGDWLAGEISLHVDHFAYKDELAERPGMPPLSHTWMIDEIQLRTTPLMQVTHGHPLYNGPDEGVHLVPDPDQESWRTVDQTRAWDDDGAYRLRCSLERPHPKPHRLRE